MSGNSNSEGAAFRPSLTGYTGEWIEAIGKWRFICDAIPDRVITGKNRAELNAKHGRLIAEDSADLLAFNHYAAANAYTPPPEDWTPPHRA